jgi:hypothetical protein
VKKAVVLAVLVLSGCGADGFPLRPIANHGFNVNEQGQVVRNCQVGGANETVQINVNC